MKSSPSLAKVAIGTALPGIPMAAVALYFSLQRGEQPYILISAAVLIGCILFLALPVALWFARR